ncbi:unnamed protein product [Arctogadus glacialis]
MRKKRTGTERYDPAAREIREGRRKEHENRGKEMKERETHTNLQERDRQNDEVATTHGENNPTATLVFTFVNETAKFRLHAVTVNITTGSGQQFYSENTNLSLWAASVGSSYMCNKEQSYNISESLALHTFDLHVQPFAVASGKFSTAHECSMDDTTALIPIIVGCALTGLILIVVVAYIIGRRKTYVGYQTL